MYTNQATAQVRQYKQSLFQGAQENDVALVRKFLEDAVLHLDLVLDHEQRNLLHAACLGGADDVLEMMLSFPKAKAKLEGRDCQKRTPLHYASAMGYGSTVRVMLGARADIDVQDEKGATPAYLATQFGWPEALKVLLEAGANPMLEDNDGQNAVDLSYNREGQVVELLSGFANQRRQTTLLRSFRRWMFASDKPQLPPQNQEEDDDDERDETGRPVAGGPVFFDDCFGEDVPPFDDGQEEGDGEQSPSKVMNALDEAVGASQAARDAGIEWDGLEPRLAAGGRGNDRKGDRKVDDRRVDDRGSGEFGLCRLHKFFGNQVRRLEFEVEWQQQRPAIGVVKPGGVADRQGLRQGDQLVEIAGKRTAGKGRDELLPLMKQRPLMLKVDRVANVVAGPQPHVELNLSMADIDFEDQGLDVTWQGHLPVVSMVQPDSRAWAAGLLEGDTIVRLNGKDVSACSQAEVSSVIDQDGLQTATVQRAPIGRPVQR